MTRYEAVVRENLFRLSPEFEKAASDLHAAFVKGLCDIAEAFDAAQHEIERPAAPPAAALSEETHG